LNLTGLWMQIFNAFKSIEAYCLWKTIFKVRTYYEDKIFLFEEIILIQIFGQINCLPRCCFHRRLFNPSRMLAFQTRYWILDYILINFWFYIRAFPENILAYFPSDSLIFSINSIDYIGQMWDFKVSFFWYFKRCSIFFWNHKLHFLVFSGDCGVSIRSKQYRILTLSLITGFFFSRVHYDEKTLKSFGHRCFSCPTPVALLSIYFWWASASNGSIKNDVWKVFPLLFWTDRVGVKASRRPK
jgi:hypothetical protein